MVPSFVHGPATRKDLRCIRFANGEKFFFIPELIVINLDFCRMAWSMRASIMQTRPWCRKQTWTSTRLQSHRLLWWISFFSMGLHLINHWQAQFHKRVAFCLDMHNQAVKAMRYADTTKVWLCLNFFHRSRFWIFHRSRFWICLQAEWESAEERRERLKQEEEMMNAMEEDDDY